MTTEFITSEKLRTGVSELVDEVASRGITYDIGTRIGRPLYQLTNLTAASNEDRLGAVSVNVDRVRRSWPEMRGTVRYLGVPFVISSPSGAVALLRRHPENKPLRAEGWLRRHQELTGETPNRAHEGQETDVTNRVSALEEANSKLQARVSALEDIAAEVSRILAGTPRSRHS